MVWWQGMAEKERAALTATLAPLRAVAEAHADGPAGYAKRIALQVLLLIRGAPHKTTPVRIALCLPVPPKAKACLPACL